MRVDLASVERPPLTRPPPMIVVAAMAAAAIAWAAVPLAQAQPATLTVCGGCAYSTIQAAIFAANAGDTISVTDSVHYEVHVVVFKDITIQGLGAASTAIDGGGNGAVFTVTQGTSATIQHLSIRNGSHSGVSLAAGGINNFGILTLSHCRFTGNSSQNSGGAMRNHHGIVTIDHCTFSGNSTSASGGAIDNILGDGLAISTSTFSGNFASLGGGAILNGGPATIDASTISGNSAFSGGGISNIGTLTVNASTLSGNAASTASSGSALGGGIANYATLAITHSTLSGNSAWIGGAIGNAGTVDATATVSNSTVSDNAASGIGGGVWNHGRLTITHSTFYGNSGVGIFNSSNTGTANLKNTIVAHDGPGSDCLSVSGGTFVASGVNLDTDGRCAALDSHFMQVTAAQLKLGPLTLNSPGTTATHALLSGSVAIDAANDCLDTAGTPVTDDQRGVFRPFGLACDIGAYEVRPCPQVIPEAPNVEACVADLGDAPDSSNHQHTSLVTYGSASSPSVVGHFPTVYDPDPVYGPSGPIHLVPEVGAIYLGSQITREREADEGLDDDVMNNLTSPSLSPQGNDGADDGLASAFGYVILPSTPNCGLASLPFTATNSKPFSAKNNSTPVYVNVWIDWTRDGDWDDVAKGCSTAPTPLREWAVQNHQVALRNGQASPLETAPFRSWHLARPVWMRITLTLEPINGLTQGGPFPPGTGRGGSGSGIPYVNGETEDYLLLSPQEVPAPTPDTDDLPDAWETAYGLNPYSSGGDDGPAGDPDHDGQTNLQEYRADTHPRGFFTRYFAEGATSGFFNTRLALLNVDATEAAVLLRFQKGDGTTTTAGLTVGALTRQTVDVNAVAGMGTAEFSTVIESDQDIVMDRTMTWDGTAYGSHAETSLPSPATTWYLAEGATHSGFDLFYLIQNPQTAAVTVTVKYLLPSGPPITKTYNVGPNSRFNIWVDADDVRLANTDVSAVITSTLPTIVERAMYLSANAQTFGAGHESAGIPAPATQWFLAEGATGPFFDLFVLVANPSDTAAQVQATFLLPGGGSLVRNYTIAANSRFNIWVDTVDAALADTAVSTVIASTNAVPIIVERSMWWPGPTAATWAEAHNAAGLTSTGTKWALADGEVGGSSGVETYILIANRGGADTARVTLLYEDSTSDTKNFPLPANSRTNVSVATEFPNAMGRRFGAVVEALGGSAAIAVERAMYSNAGGVVWAAGTDAVATQLE
ncbi:MAG: choice-of-anchor Q domain-containing protein [Vicinamibacterales bacterium]